MAKDYLGTAGLAKLISLTKDAIKNITAEDIGAFPITGGTLSGNVNIKNEKTGKTITLGSNDYGNMGLYCPELGIWLARWDANNKLTLSGNEDEVWKAGDTLTTVCVANGYTAGGTAWWINLPLSKRVTAKKATVTSVNAVVRCPTGLIGTTKGMDLLSLSSSSGVYIRPTGSLDLYFTLNEAPSGIVNNGLLSIYFNPVTIQFSD